MDGGNYGPGRDPATSKAPPVLITQVHAQDINGLLGNATQFLPIVLIFVVFYFLLIRPQQQRQKELRAMLAAVKRGDRVVTAGGILATVQKVSDREVDVDIAPNVRVTVMRDTISSVVKPLAADNAKGAKQS